MHHHESQPKIPPFYYPTSQSTGDVLGYERKQCKWLRTKFYNISHDMLEIPFNMRGKSHNKTPSNAAVTIPVTHPSGAKAAGSQLPRPLSPSSLQTQFATVALPQAVTIRPARKSFATPKWKRAVRLRMAKNAQNACRMVSNCARSVYTSRLTERESRGRSGNGEKKKDVRRSS
jgi:hypothetical protein